MERRPTPPPPPSERPPSKRELHFVVESQPEIPELPPRPGPPPPPGASARAPAPLVMARQESLGDAVGRIGVGHLDRAISALSRTDAADGNAAIAAARGLLRLVRAAVGDRVYLFEDKRLRDARSSIAAAYAAAIAPFTLTRFRENLADRLAPATFRQLEYALWEHSQQPYDTELADALETLVAMRTRWLAFTVPEIEDEYRLIEPGLRLTYAKGQLRMGESIRHPTDRAYARWGIQVRYLRDQSTMLHADWDTLGLSDRLRALNGPLSEARRLTTMVDAARRTVDNGEDAELLEMLVVGRCHDLYQQAMSPGTRLYADEPADFTAEFGKHWRQWRAS